MSDSPYLLQLRAIKADLDDLKTRYNDERADLMRKRLEVAITAKRTGSTLADIMRATSTTSANWLYDGARAIDSPLTPTPTASHSQIAPNSSPVPSNAVHLYPCTTAPIPEPYTGTCATTPIYTWLIENDSQSERAFVTWQAVENTPRGGIYVPAHTRPETKNAPRPIYLENSPLHKVLQGMGAKVPAPSEKIAATITLEM